jgi:adenosylmethionine-8-amino-7-oxononanoate aminotransferase
LGAAEELERAILLEGPETVSAFFAEPVVGPSASGLVPGPDYYRRIREICDKYDVLFVTDEVLCGYGRTGKVWAIEHWGVEPDIITAGKMIGSGYVALGAMIVSDKIVEALRSGTGRFVHGFTYSGMPAACFVGVQVAGIMQREKLVARAADKQEKLFAGLRALAERHPMIGEVRGLGLMAGIEFVADRETRQPFAPDAKITDRVVSGMRRRGVLVGSGVPGINYGRDGDHIQLTPPLIIEDEEIDTVVTTLDAVLSEDFADEGSKA